MRTQVLALATVTVTETAGCGRIEFASIDAATDVAPIDVAPDANERCSISAPFTDIAPIVALNSTMTDGGVRLSDDELTAVFHSSNGGPFGIWTATRTDRHLPFDPPTRLFTGTTFWPALSSDGLALVYNDANDLLVSRRNTTSAAFTAGTTVLETMTASGEGTASFGRSGSTLYFTRFMPDGKLTVSPWPALTSGQPVQGLDTAVEESAPALSADELTMYFMRNTGSPDIYVAERPDTESAFGTPRLVSELMTASAEAPGWLSADQCRLYFETDRVGSSFDLYLAQRAP